MGVVIALDPKLVIVYIHLEKDFEVFSAHGITVTTRWLLNNSNTSVRLFK